MVTPADRIIRDDMTELMRMRSFHRFLHRWFKTGLLDTIGKGSDARGLEFREGARSLIMAMITEAQGTGSNLDATLIQIMSATEQTARKEIARGGSRHLNDGSDGDPDGDDDGRVD